MNGKTTLICFLLSAFLFLIGLHGCGISEPSDSVETKPTESMTEAPNEPLDVEIEESNPSNPESTTETASTDAASDLVEMYLNVIRDIYKEDSALNDSIQTIALDFTKLNNLSEEEKDALAGLVEKEYGFQVIQKTYEQLRDEGFIDIENLYYPDGILITIGDQKMKHSSFYFDVTKWRSGLGAIGYGSCTAKRKEGTWRYKLDRFWIS